MLAPPRAALTRLEQRAFRRAVLALAMVRMGVVHGVEVDRAFWREEAIRALRFLRQSNGFS